MTENTPEVVLKVVCCPSVVGSRSTVFTSIVPSTSVSLDVILRIAGVSSLVVAALLFATGASFTGVTVIFTVAVFDVAPKLSLTV